MQDLAESAGCSKSYISSLERGLSFNGDGPPSQPSKRMVLALATALGASHSEALVAAGYRPDESLTSIAETIGDELAPIVEQIPVERRKAFITQLAQTARVWAKQCNI